jgi:prepilin-type N-terminal cleavage/methylation domain-containing protein
MRRCAFTLTELLVALAIVAVLLALVLPAVPPCPVTAAVRNLTG